MLPEHRDPADLIPTTIREVELAEMHMEFEEKIGAAEPLPDSLKDPQAVFDRIIKKKPK